MMYRQRLLLALIPTFVAIIAPNSALSSTFEASVTLSGTLISHTRRSALINGEVVREGERIAGIEILEIHKGGVRVLSGSEEYLLRIGAGAQPALVRPTPTSDRRSASIRKVNSGDTLSEIAMDYTGGEVSLNQVMVALFEANPFAFAGNINRLRAGAELRIPETGKMRRHTRETAMAKVQRQTKTWQAQQVAPVQVVQSEIRIETDPIAVGAQIEAHEYGPVRYGETLSEIAIQVSGHTISMDQMMTALFNSNRHAFGQSIDLLREGAVLRVPDFVEIQSTATLTAFNH